MGVCKMRSTNSAPDALSNSYFTGSPPTGTSMMTFRLSGGVSPVGIRSISMARPSPRPCCAATAPLRNSAPLRQKNSARATQHVDRESDHADVENEGGEAVQQRDLADRRRADLHVRGLEGHAQGEGEIGEIRIGRRSG